MKVRSIFLAVFAAAVLAVIGFMQPGAYAEGDLEITMTDVTATDMSTLKGESKILVGINGNAKDVSIIQLEFLFEGDLKYKSIQYLTGENAPEKGKYILSPDVSAANREGRFTTSITTVWDKYTLEGSTELFILTFAGEPSQTGTLSLAAESQLSYVTVGKDDARVSGGSIDMTASETGVQAVNAQIEFLIKAEDADFYPSPAEVGFKSGIFFSLTDRETGSVFNMEIDFNEISKGGNHKRISEAGDEFLITETLISDHTYDMTVSGEGYIPFYKEEISFAEGEPFALTSDDLVPMNTIMTSRSRNTAEFIVYSGDQRELTGYLASYDSEGRLKDAKKTVLEGGRTSMKLGTGAAEYRTFVWNDSMEPAASAVDQ